jgi:1-pyrroline-5-carboxylate dehydrogenase
LKITLEDVPVVIEGKEIRTNNTAPIVIPHNHKHELGKYHKASKKEVQQAIDAALEARHRWAATDFEER